MKAACGGIFRDSKDDLWGSFVWDLGHENALYAELMGAIFDMEHARSKNCNMLWLETDSKLEVLAFSKPFVVPWNLRNIWDNCVQALRRFDFLGNTHLQGRAVKPANLGIV